MQLRLAVDADGPAIAKLVSACWAEYPGCVMAWSENRDLEAIATHFARAGGVFWVAEADGAIIGTIGTKPRHGGCWELCRLYVDASKRGGGIAAMLVELVEAHVRKAGGTELELWSDTRFSLAHRFYRHKGFTLSPACRPLFDLSNSWEFQGVKRL